jgi:hypothetical protein
MILVHCSPSNPSQLFSQYLEAMSQDFIHKYNTSTRIYTTTDDQIIAYVAAEIANSLLGLSKERTNYDLPPVDFTLAFEVRKNPLQPDSKWTIVHLAFFFFSSIDSTQTRRTNVNKCTYFQ